MDSSRSTRNKRNLSHHETLQTRDHQHQKSVSASARSAHAPREPTIRKVPPETSLPEEIISQLDELSLGNAPRTSSRTAKSEKRRSITRGHTISDFSDGDYGIKSLKDPPASLRPRTRTLDDRGGEKPLGSQQSRAGRRAGSLHSTETTTHRARQEPVASIGHPSTVSVQPASLERHVKSAVSGRDYVAPMTNGHEASLPRTAHPSILSHQRRYQHRTQPIQPPQLPGCSNGKKILALMRSGRGQMEGALAFRKTEHIPWSLSHCLIDCDNGSLLSEVKGDKNNRQTLLPDLRGCKVRVAFDVESFLPFLEVFSHSSLSEMQLRPQTQEQLDSWFAALLCWQPIRPKGIKTKISRPQPPILGDRRPVDTRRHSEISLLKEAPIIKVGKMIFWDTSVSFGNAGTSDSSRSPLLKTHSFGSRRWRRVSCTLRENGELKLYSDTDITLISVVQLSQLSRYAIQRLDPSVLDSEFCIAIFPQYRTPAKADALRQPIFLSLESRVLFEVWMVLLKIFAVPHLYGSMRPLGHHSEQAPATSRRLISSSDLETFRMTRCLSIRVMEARLAAPLSPKLPEIEGRDRLHGAANASLMSDYFVEVLLDGETRAKTLSKDEGGSLLWIEEFSFHDLPEVMSTLSFVLKKRPPNALYSDRPSWMREERSPTQNSLSSLDVTAGYAEMSLDIMLGQIDIYLDDLDKDMETERWWPMVNLYGQKIGEILVRVGIDETPILMLKEYQAILDMLRNISSGLTQQIAQTVPNELRRLSEYLLNMFQVSGQASEWLMALAEEEIDGVRNKSISSRPRYTKRTVTSEFGETLSAISDRELIVRDLGKSATLEANLLFRGNTLLTKSLDLHMKRVGKEYLEETLMEPLRNINSINADCEVDPNRIVNVGDLDKHWRRLILVTSQVWQAISASCFRCPAELRRIFRHIRACAEDRYGDFLRTVSYSSVSGFLFLRFFCPAILNPKMFALMKGKNDFNLIYQHVLTKYLDQPQANARRTLTLVAKSLQGLANMTTFGSKEPWMEHMNQFLTSNRQSFKCFIDNICSIPSDRNPLPLPPSYSTPLAIMQRLPQSCREGLPSLPHLIDQPRNLALLVSLWLRGTANNATAAALLMDSDSSSDDNSGSNDSLMKKNNIINGKKAHRTSTGSQAYAELRRFNELCHRVQHRTDEYLQRAERADRPRSVYNSQWEEMVEQLEQSAPLDGVAPASAVPRESRVVTGPVTLSGTNYSQAEYHTQTQAHAHAQTQAQAQAQSPVSSTVSGRRGSSSLYSNEEGTLSETYDDSSTVANMAAAAAAAVTRTGFRTSVSGRSSRKGSNARHGSVASGTEEHTTALPPLEQHSRHGSRNGAMERDKEGRAERDREKDKEKEKGSSGGGSGRFKGFTMPGFSKRRGAD